MSFRYPLDKFTITQGWGDNPDYYKQFGQLGHNGLDLGDCPVGTPVLASDNGTVFYEGLGNNQPLMGSIAGICVILDHGSVMTGYAHLRYTTINIGQTVEKGQIIGYSGMTGIGTGPHLHFEFIGKPVDINNGYYGRVNPSQYLEGDKMAIITIDAVVALSLATTGKQPSNDDEKKYINQPATQENIDGLITYWAGKSTLQSLGNQLVAANKEVARLKALPTSTGGDTPLAKDTNAKLTWIKALLSKIFK